MTITALHWSADLKRNPKDPKNDGNSLHRSHVQNLLSSFGLVFEPRPACIGKRGPDRGRIVLQAGSSEAVLKFKRMY